MRSHDRMKTTLNTTRRTTPAKKSGSPAARSPLESLSALWGCSMKFSPGAVPFGPISVDVVVPGTVVGVCAVSTT